MLAALSGCQKEEEIFDSARFYAYSSPINPFTAAVVGYLQKRDDSTHLSVDISKRYGFPVWNKAQCVKSGDKVLLYVPLAKNEEKSVSGVWYFAQEGNSISYRVLSNNPSQPGFDQYFWMIDYFDQALFGHSVYQYKESRTNGYLKTEASDYDIVTHCKDAYVYDEYKGTYCWDEIVGDSSIGPIDLSDTGKGNDFTPPSGGGTTPAEPKPEVDTTNATFRNTKAACILDKLLGKTNTTMYDPNTVVGKLLKDYWGTTHKLTFVVADNLKTGNSGHAECEPLSTGNVIIRLKRDYIESCTNFELARTLIHESVHAEIFARLQGPKTGISGDQEFYSLFEKYKDYCKQTDHNIMAESDYVNLIAQGLKAYHDAGYMKDFDANISTKYYGDFDYQKLYSMEAWVGLDNTSQFNINKSNTSWHNDYLNYTKAPRTYKDSNTCN